jgi:nucleotide-binding universal stress UspA family protein
MSTELIVPLDGSPLADLAIPHAAEIARRTGGSLHLLRVHTPLNLTVVPSDAMVSIPDPVLDAQIRDDAEAWLAARAREVGASSRVPVTYELRVGLAAAEIVLASAARRAKLAVCTTRGAGSAATRWLGSTADGIVRHAWCPVLAMSPEAAARGVSVRSLLVLLDGSEASGAIIPHAGWFAGAFDAKIDYLRLVPSPAHPARAILDYVARTKPDVVALSTHGRGFLRLFLDSVADEVVRNCERPTLVFRPQGLPWAKRAKDLAVASATGD